MTIRIVQNCLVYANSHVRRFSAGLAIFIHTAAAAGKPIRWRLHERIAGEHRPHTLAVRNGDDASTTGCRRNGDKLFGERCASIIVTCSSSTCSTVHSKDASSSSMEGREMPQLILSMTLFKRVNYAIISLMSLSVKYDRRKPRIHSLLRVCVCWWVKCPRIRLSD